SAGWSGGTVVSFFFRAADVIRDRNVTGVQTCALPILGLVGGLRGHEHLVAASLPRDEVFVPSKVPNEAQGYESTLRSVEASLADLGLEELDLHLIHWPRPTEGLAVDTWKALVHLHEQGYIRSIGVSNFRVEDLELVEAETG